MAALFDLSFSHFITEKVVAFIYVLGIAAGALVTIAYVMGAIGAATFVRQARGAGIVAVFLAPFVFLLFVIGLRLSLEVTVVLFRIASHTRVIARHAATDLPAAPGAPPPASPLHPIRI